MHVRLELALFESIGGTELLIVGIAALLVFGKRLPEVASQAGSTFAKFKNSLTGAIHESGVQREIQKLKQVLPTELSMSDVARAAARRVEERLRENEVEGAPSATATAPTGEAALDAPPAPPADAPASDRASTPPSTPAAPTGGVDPAKHFGQPGSVPRE